jgi:hypothetical protein
LKLNVEKVPVAACLFLWISMSEEAVWHITTFIELMIDNRTDD